MPTPSESLEFTRGPRWANRIALAPLTNMQSGPDGTLGDDEYSWLVRRAEGGFGMVMTCAAFTDAHGHTFDGQLGVAGPHHLEGLTRLADGLRAAGTVSSIQLQHGGRRADGALGSIVAPWADPEKNAARLSTSEVQGVVADFAAAAALAERAGFDGAEIHGAHGYLISQFLDARFNDRDDRYGGDLADRFRIVHEVIDAIRAATGPDFQLGIRISPERYGLPLADAVVLVRELLADDRLDYVDLSMWDVFKDPYEDRHRDRPLLDHLLDIPRGGTRLGVAGKILSGPQVRDVLDRGVDFVLIGTAGILHHDFARLVLADPDFASIAQPVSAQHMIDQSVGSAFLHYLSTNWDDFVVAD